MAFDIRNTPLYAESWNVAFRHKPQGTILSDRKTPFAVIPNSLHYWAADPMVFTHEGRTYIFAELYDYTLCRGIIGVSEYRGNGSFGVWKPIIQEDFHMSYPYVFRTGEEIYMIPETTQKNALLLYRAVEFPMRWELHKVICENVCWADTTIIPDGDGFLGRTQACQNGRDLDLQIRLTRELELQDRTERPDSDTRINRPGGRPFFHQGRWWWVSRDCREGYGKALFFRSDREEAHLLPQELNYSHDFYLDGMHTYSATEEFEVIDLKTRRLNPLNLCTRLIAKFRRRRR